MLGHHRVIDSPPEPAPRHALTARLLAAAAAVTMALAAIAGCTRDGTAPGSTESPGSRHDTAEQSESPGSTPGDIGTTDRTGSASTTALAPHRGPVPDGAAHFAVGTITHEFVDTNRGRTLRTIVYFPAEGAPGEPGSVPAAGAFPLVLMAHGYRLPSSGYERILSTVAAAGFVVAAPAFPHTSAEVGDGNRSDIVNQPADLSFLVDSVPALGRAHRGVLPEIADPDRVGALGHSDGGLTVSAWAYGNTYRDRRVAAAVVMTGGIGLFGGTFFAADSPPLLAIHATDDETNPYAASVNLFARMPVGIPRYLLTIQGGSHLGPYMFDTAMPEVAQVIVDFLDAYLLGDAASVQRLLGDGNKPGTMAIRDS